MAHSSYLIQKFSIRNSSLISKAESRKPAGALDSCFVLFGTPQQCAPAEPGGNRARDLKVRKPVSNRCATSARSPPEFSTSPINLQNIYFRKSFHLMVLPYLKSCTAYRRCHLLLYYIFTQFTFTFQQLLQLLKKRPAIDKCCPNIRSKSVYILLLFLHKQHL